MGVEIKIYVALKKFQFLGATSHCSDFHLLKVH